MTNDRERVITRLSVLRSAATFCSGRAISNDVKSTDVLAIAAMIRLSDGVQQPGPAAVASRNVRKPNLPVWPLARRGH